MLKSSSILVGMVREDLSEVVTFELRCEHEEAADEDVGKERFKSRDTKPRGPEMGWWMWRKERKHRWALGQGGQGAQTGDDSLGQHLQATVSSMDFFLLTSYCKKMSSL